MLLVQKVGEIGNDFQTIFKRYFLKIFIFEINLKKKKKVQKNGIVEIMKRKEGAAVFMN